MSFLLDTLAMRPPFDGVVLPEEVVYVIHFLDRFHHCQHYVGTTKDLARRLEDHRSGNGSCLMRAIGLHQIEWELVVIFPGGHDLERAIKNHHNARAFCPKCREEYLVRHARNQRSSKQRKGVIQSL